MTDRTFEFLVNAFKQASQSQTPAEMGYADKRKALFAHEAALRAEVARLTEDLRCARAEVDNNRCALRAVREAHEEAARLRDLLRRWSEFQAAVYVAEQRYQTVELIADTARILAAREEAGG